MIARRRNSHAADMVGCIERFVVDPRRTRPNARQPVRALAQPLDVLSSDTQPFGQRRPSWGTVEKDQVSNDHPEHRVVADAPHDRPHRTHSI